VKPAHENQGIGQKFLQYLEQTARQQGITRLLALSTQAFAWFQQKAGFTEGSVEDLPRARRERYAQSGRNSKILIKLLK
jgi:amino-acid N-acetyltransferase